MASVQQQEGLDPTALAALSAEDVAAVIRTATDEQLRALATDPDVRSLVIDDVIRRFPDFLDRDAVAEETAVVALALTGLGKDDRFALYIDRGDCRAERADVKNPRVTLRLDVVDALRLVTGGGDPAMLYLSGGLELSGDEAYVVRLASFFRVPGGPSEKLDVTGGDADSLASIVRTAPDDHLRRTMEGPMRDIVLEEVFRRFPEHIDPSKTKGVRGIVAWKITGPGGRADRFRVALDDGVCRTGEDAGDGDARVTIICDGVTFLKLVTGSANPALAFLTRRLRLKGDIGFAAQLPTWFRVPGGAPPVT